MKDHVPTFGELVRLQGRTCAGLARLTGYSQGHVRRVARGEHTGSKAFHAAMTRILGAEYRVSKVAAK